ncbi:MAG TPA: N-acetylmuramoyl-L-alanine amidase [Planctomycetes bacterium]|nr:N-acetylmuramoyl-L-alanine amidase [Planctomycetota bacterium]
MMSRRLMVIILALGVTTGCASQPPVPAAGPDGGEEPGVVYIAGEARPIAIPVVTFRDRRGFDAYLERCAFDDGLLPGRPAPGCETPRRYRPRPSQSDGWDPKRLREEVNQFVIHYDVCVTSHRCFEVLQDLRGLSVHFMLDVDGTLYQSLDLAERARHAGVANDHSVGIEIAHVGAYPPGKDAWRKRYRLDAAGQRWLSIEEALEPPPGGPFLVAGPSDRTGVINGRRLVQAEFTEAQYRTLEVLTDFLCREFPRLRRDAPRDATGEILTRCLTKEELASFRGILGHFHVSRRKSDPGPAFRWRRILRPSRP